MNRGFGTLITTAMAALFMFFTIIAGPLFAQAPADLPGTLAYFRVVGATQTKPGTLELHFVNPDGGNDRMIFRTPRGLATIFPSPIWRPDGREIAFISPQEFESSAYNSDIFALRQDGAELRRITNPPKGEDLARLPQGSVTVTVKNMIMDSTVYFVYVEGAQKIISVTVSPRNSATVTVDHVADLGRKQFVYVKSGSGIWFSPSAYADVVPGQTVAAAGMMQIATGFGPFELRIKGCAWKSDGSEIAYLVAGSVQFLPASPAVGQFGQNLFMGDTTLVNGSLAWSPVSDEFLYYSSLASPRGIYRGVKGSSVSTHPLVLKTDYVAGIDWLPDGSGFLYATQNFGYSSNRIFKYDFKSNQATVLVEGGRFLSPAEASPDGRYFAFANRANENAPFDLFGKAIDGNRQWKIASDLVSWDWGPAPATGVK
jgi:hypothetical protein